MNKRNDDLERRKQEAGITEEWLDDFVKTADWTQVSQSKHLKWFEEASIQVRVYEFPARYMKFAPMWANRIARENKLPVAIRRKMLKKLQECGDSKTQRAVVSLIELGAIREALDHIDYDWTVETVSYDEYKEWFPGGTNG